MIKVFVCCSFRCLTDMFDHLPCGWREVHYLPLVCKFWAYSNPWSSNISTQPVLNLVLSLNVCKPIHGTGYREKKVVRFNIESING